MNFFGAIIRFFQGGGEMMYPIAIVLVIGVAIAIERYMYLTYTSLRNRSLWNEVSPLLAQGNFRQAVQVVVKEQASAFEETWRPVSAEPPIPFDHRPESESGFSFGRLKLSSVGSGRAGELAVGTAEASFESALSPTAFTAETL